MDGLKDWVRGLVMLIILASALELLLPMTAMKKYVRMSLGLLIVLAVIRPAFDLLGREVVVDTSLFVQDEGQQLPSLNQIMARAADYRERNQALVLQEARERLRGEALEAAQAVSGVSGARAEVDVGLKEGLYEIREVTITLTEGSSAPSGASAVRPVEPVSPVEPPVLKESKKPSGDAGLQEASGGAAVVDPPAETVAQSEALLVASVRTAVAARLGIRNDPALIRVLYDPNPDASRRRQP